MTTPFDTELLEDLWRGDWRAASGFTAALPDEPPPHAYALIERAAAVGLELEEIDAEPDERIALRGQGVRVALQELSVDRDHRLRGELTEPEADALDRSVHAVRVDTILLEPVLDEYHTALRAVDALAPDAVAVADEQRLQWLSGTWMRRAAASHAPPPPASLYSLHVVVDDDHAWMHTHGLLRCGSIEVEALDVPREHVDSVAHLVRAAASRFIERGPPPPGESFEVGDGLVLAWRPWDACAAERPDAALGGTDDRDDHDGLVGTLVVPTGRKRGLLRRVPVWAPVTDLVPIIDDEPLFYVSTMETRRMAMLASDRFRDFRSLFRRHGGRDDWTFMVKLGYQIDDDESDPDRASEHLWFDVHGIDGAEIDATLLNAPIQIARMEAGDRAIHTADQLSDWTVHTPDGAFGPDRVDALLRPEE